MITTQYHFHLDATVPRRSGGLANVLAMPIRLVRPRPVADNQCEGSYQVWDTSSQTPHIACCPVCRVGPRLLGMAPPARRVKSASAERGPWLGHVPPHQDWL